MPDEPPRRRPRPSSDRPAPSRRAGGDERPPARPAAPRGGPASSGRRPERPAGSADRRPPSGRPAGGGPSRSGGAPPRGPAAPRAGGSGSGRPPRREGPRLYDQTRTRRVRLPRDPRARAGLAVGAVVLLLLVVALGTRAANSGRILPGTTVAGVDVGGVDRDRAAGRIEGVLSPSRTVALRAGGDVQRVTLSDLGYRPDRDATLDAAEDAGRGGFLFGLPSTLAGLVSERNVPVSAAIDRKKLNAAAARVAKRVDDDPYPGALSIDPDTREVSVRAGRPGREVDRGRLTAVLRSAALRGSDAPVDVPLKRVAPVSRNRLNTIATDAEQYLREPIRFTFGGRATPLELGRGEASRLLALEGRDGGQSAALGVDRARLTALLDRLSARGSRRARSARISAPAVTASFTTKGDATWRARSADVSVRDGRVGRAVDREKLGAALRRAIASGSHTIAVPTTTVQPDVSTSSAEQVDSLIGTFTTPYVAGQPRVTNIKRMAQTVDGTVIAPGSRFSLNGITGERTKAKGYVEAPFIAAGNKLEPSVGGGVSQFSTTTYNAAYFAGLPLEAFQAHSLYIDRYPPGRESTLNFPSIDLRWLNDTGAPILVRTSTTDAGVTVSLYGKDNGRRVTSTVGDRSAVPGGDFKITVTRTIRRQGGETSRVPVTTTYGKEAAGGEE